MHAKIQTMKLFRTESINTFHLVIFNEKFGFLVSVINWSLMHADNSSTIFLIDNNYSKPSNSVGTNWFVVVEVMAVICSNELQ